MTIHHKTEFELKLTGAPEEVAAMRDWLRPPGRNADAGAWERLACTYYDTPDLKLRAAGVALRVREEGGRRLKTVKVTPAGGSSVARTEVEKTIKRGEAIDRPVGLDVVDDLLGAHGSALAPVARTLTDNWSAVLTVNGSLVEASLDLGRAERLGPDGIMAQRGFAEAEFELLKGDPEAVFALARRSVEESEGRLKPSLATKLERALGAAGDGDLAAPEKIRLSGAESAGDVLEAGLKAAAIQIIRLAPYVYESRDPEAARRMRVALRRLRSIERVFRKAAASADLEALAGRARTVARAIGAARDWDVFIADTVPLAREQLAGRSRGGLDLLAERADALRAEAWTEAARLVGGATFSAFALDLLEAAYLQQWRAGEGARLSEDVRRFGARALDRRREKALAVGQSLAEATPDAGHPLRIELKKLRYTAQTFRSLYPKDVRKPYFEAMTGLQDVFGALNDAVVAQALAEEAAAGVDDGIDAAQGFIAGFKGAQAQAALASARDKWTRFAATAPFWREEGGEAFESDAPQPARSEETAANLVERAVGMPLDSKTDPKKDPC